MLLKKIRSLFASESTSEIAESGRLTLEHRDDETNVAGVVRFHLRIAEDVASNCALQIECEHGQFFIDGLHGGRVAVVGLHLHLLPNGIHSIKFALREGGGTTSQLSTKVLVNHETELARETSRLLQVHGTPLFFSGPCDSSMYPYDLHTAWFDRPEAGAHIGRLLELGQINAEEAENLRSFVRDGFLVLPNLIDEGLVSEVNEEIDHAIGAGYQGYKYGASQRIEHLHNNFPKVRKLWLDERHRRYANLIFGSAARPCQTLTYVFGSEQDAHQDTIHLTPFPAGYMCGTWIALQDVVPDSGELVVYRGSHRERRVYMAETGCSKVQGDWSAFGQSVGKIWGEMASRYEPFIYRPTKGTVLIWHENLLHGGSVRKDPTLERRSIVIHCFADGALAYYDSTGLAGSAVSVKEFT